MLEIKVIGYVNEFCVVLDLDAKTGQFSDRVDTSEFSRDIYVSYESYNGCSTLFMWEE